jgi:hypothetical protein
VIHNFSETDAMGLFPIPGLVQATDGKFYGASGSNYSSGVIFQVTSTGTFTVLFNLTNTAGLYPGQNPQAALFQNTNGTLYGDTYGGGPALGGVPLQPGYEPSPIRQFRGSAI